MMAIRATKAILPMPCALRHCATTLAATAPNSSTTAARDPLGFTEANVSKIICASSAESKEIFPRGLPKNFITQIDCFKKTGWILRAPTHDIVSQLRTGSDQPLDNKFLIYGGDGYGKTICLSQVVHWCWKAGWLVVHVPGVSFWAHSRKELRLSSKYPGTYDQAHEASIWLKNFKTVNAKLLKNIRLSESRVWTKREKSEKGEELEKVIDQGLHKPVLATDVVGVVLEELLREHARRASLQDDQEKLKLLLAVDEANNLFSPCAASMSKLESIEPHQLNLIKNIRSLCPADKFPGAVVLSLSRHRTFRCSARTCSPQDLLGSEGMEALSGYKHVMVEKFSREEVLRLLQYYKENNWVTKEPFDQVYQEVWHLSEGSPSEIYKLSSLL